MGKDNNADKKAKDNIYHNPNDFRDLNLFKLDCTSFEI